MSKSGDRQKAKHEVGGIPSPFWYPLGIAACRLLFRILRVRIQTDPDVLELKGPAIVLGNHASYLDPMLSAVGCWPQRVHFLAQNNLFRKWLLRYLLIRVGCIPKIQFRTDTRAVKAMFRVLRRGGFLGVFPEATRSPAGMSQPFEDAIARTAKKYKTAVVVSHIDGAYLTWPRWAARGAKLRIGRIDNRNRILYTHEQVEQMTVEELHAGIREALTFNDYDWQRENRVRFSSRNQAAGLDNILHQCPRCGKELVIRARKNRIRCISCNNQGIMDHYGLLSPAANRDVVFDDPAEWYRWQKDKMAERVRSPQFSLEAKVPMLEISHLDEPFRAVGNGKVRVNREGISFQGTLDREPVRFSVPMSRIPGLSANFGKRFELVLKDVSYRMHLENGQQVVQFWNAVEACREGCDARDDAGAAPSDPTEKRSV